MASRIGGAHPPIVTSRWPNLDPPLQNSKESPKAPKDLSQRSDWSGCDLTSTKAQGVVVRTLPLTQLPYPPQGVGEGTYRKD